MRDIWLISDTHFSHENIIGYCDRPFKDKFEMNQCMQDNWSDTVKDGDIVYHLGDVYFNYCPDLGQLPGKKRLILGNHDNAKDMRLREYFKKIQLWRMFPEFGLLLTHVPVHENTLERSKGNLTNVHGHTHANGSPKGPYKSVCVELTDYKPINIEDLRTK